MYNPRAGYVTGIRDITWLDCLYYGQTEARDEVVVYLQVSLPFEPKDAKAREGMMLNVS